MHQSHESKKTFNTNRKIIFDIGKGNSELFCIQRAYSYFCFLKISQIWRENFHLFYQTHWLKSFDLRKRKKVCTLGEKRRHFERKKSVLCVKKLLVWAENDKWTFEVEMCTQGTLSSTIYLSIFKLSNKQEKYMCSHEPHFVVHGLKMGTD